MRLNSATVTNAAQKNVAMGLNMPTIIARKQRMKAANEVHEGSMLPANVTAVCLPRYCVLVQNTINQSFNQLKFTNPDVTHQTSLPESTDECTWRQMTFWSALRENP